MARQCFFTFSEYEPNKGHAVYVADENEGYVLYGYFGDDSDRNNSLIVTDKTIIDKNSKKGFKRSDIDAILTSIGVDKDAADPQKNSEFPPDLKNKDEHKYPP